MGCVGDGVTHPKELSSSVLACALQMLTGFHAACCQGELAKKMLDISREVANLQKEISEIREGRPLDEAIEPMQGVARSNGGEAVDASWADGHEARSGGTGHAESDTDDEDAWRTGALSPGSSPRVAAASSPSLRPCSAYCESGKVEPRLPRRGIVWSPEVRDNAKAKGEDSLADIIKKRALRQRVS